MTDKKIEELIKNNDLMNFLFSEKEPFIFGGFNETNRVINIYIDNFYYDKYEENGELDFYEDVFKLFFKFHFEDFHFSLNIEKYDIEEDEY